MGDGASGSSAPSSNRNVMIVLAYLGPFALIPFLLEKGDSEVQWHAKHGLVLFGAELILFVAVQTILIVLGSFMWLIGLVFVPLLMVPFLILHALAIIKGLDGSRLIIPGLSDYADRF